MIYTKPNYYDEFCCIADKCPDTCCAGWQIVIDDKSLERYENEKSAYRRQLLDSIDWQEGVFKQKEKKRCAFLNEKNLCDMYLHLGEESLCYTCTNYPRHIEEFENIREYTLSVSCPEVARILLNKKDLVEFLYEEDEEEEEFEDYDPFLFSILEDGREVIRKILQNRNLDISQRAYLVWKLADEMQECIDDGELFVCHDIFDKYQKKQHDLFSIEQESECWKNNMELSYNFFIQVYKKIYRLERLLEDWEAYLTETEEILYTNGIEKYQEIREEFYQWLTEHIPDWQIMMEQLLVYFIYTYFCGAVYDGAVVAKARMSIVSVYFIFEMLMARWQKNNGTLDREEIIFMVYKYSRELEHSDENLNLMEEMMEEI